MYSSFFEKFILSHQLELDAAAKLWLYAGLIVEWNEKFNLTAKTTVDSVIRELFGDALIFGKFFDVQQLTSIADAGTGAGIPGLVLKIVYPQLELVLIEVNSKKRDFLEYVTKRLALENVIISGLDWRTFNRKTNYDIDCFVTKAAFADDEIIRMFRNNCNYRDKRMVYWTTAAWSASKNALPYVKESHPYSLGGKQLQLVVFAVTTPI